MNYNANAGGRPPGPTRKIKRVSDVTAMGMPPARPPNQQQVLQPSYDLQNSFDTIPSSQQQFHQMSSPFNEQQIPSHMSNQYTPQYPPSGVGIGVGGGTPSGNFQHTMMQPQQQQLGVGSGVGNQQQFPAQIQMFQQPIVQDMALQYGQKLADHGKQLVESHIEKYVPITRLKYYFSVDNKYVINKLRLIFFPYVQKEWSLKYDEDNPVQPRFDINAPDLYIPTMAYITYVVLAGLVLGMQNRFSPEQLGIMASSALAYSIFELIIYSVILYVTNIPTTLKTLDLIAFSGYKFVIIVVCIVFSILFQNSGYYMALLYCSVSLAFFLLRTLKAKILEPIRSSTNIAGVSGYDTYGVPPQQQQQQEQHMDYTIGRKRKLYFLFLVAGIQPVLSFWLSLHLIPNRQNE